MIVIGDNIADSEGARAAGAVAITVQTGFEEPEALVADDSCTNRLRGGEGCGGCRGMCGGGHGVIGPLYT